MLEISIAEPVWGQQLPPGDPTYFLWIYYFNIILLYACQSKLSTDDTTHFFTLIVFYAAKILDLPHWIFKFEPKVILLSLTHMYTYTLLTNITGFATVKP